MICRPVNAGPSTPRRGMVLLAVLLVVVLLTLAAYQYVELMTAEYRAVDSYRRSAQARVCAESGVHYTAALLAANPGTSYFDDATSFSGILVHQSDVPRFQGRFSVISPLGPDETSGSGQNFRYGVSDEGGKINLNALLQLDSSGKIAHDLLLGLPNMTEEVANAIIDWMDPDDTERASGAEQNYYSTLTPPYRCKNGPLDSLEELLFVKGVTPSLLFGNDRNRNGIIDADEDDGSGTLDRGWSAYLTVYGREQNLDEESQPRVYVNDQDINATWDKLTAAVGEDLANFIIAYRIYGPASGTAGSTATGKLSRSSIKTDGARPRAIASLYELVNVQVSIPSSDPKQTARRYASPLNDKGAQKTLLPLLLDKITTLRDAEIPGRININTAPQAVLAALPGLSDADVQTIVSRRPQAGVASDDPVYESPAWLLTEANLPVATMRTLERYITARSQVYRMQVVGFFDGGGPQARVEAVIDTNNGMPRILYWRNLTELGRAYELNGANQGGQSTAPN